jgi:hypothetical protein
VGNPKERKMGEKTIDFYLPVVYAITLKTTAKDLAVIHTQMIRAPLKDEKPGVFAEIDQKLKEHAANHIVKLGGVLSLPGLYLHVTSIVHEKDPEEKPSEQEKEKKEDGTSAE